MFWSGGLEQWLKVKVWNRISFSIPIRDLTDNDRNRQLSSKLCQANLTEISCFHAHIPEIMFHVSLCPCAYRLETFYWSDFWINFSVGGILRYSDTLKCFGLVSQNLADHSTNQWLVFGLYHFLSVFKNSWNVRKILKSFLIFGAFICNHSACFDKELLKICLTILQTCENIIAWSGSPINIDLFRIWMINQIMLFTTVWKKEHFNLK